jgi:hypothetical protein
LGELAFSDFRGYENWKVVAVSQTETLLKVIVANDVTMDAYRQGFPAEGKVFPEGPKIVKIEWTFKKNAVAPYFVMVPDTLKAVATNEKDSNRFPDTHGWAYGNFNCDAASDTFYASRERRKMRVRVPYDGSCARLHFHGVSEEVSAGRSASSKRLKAPPPSKRPRTGKHGLAGG